MRCLVRNIVEDAQDLAVLFLEVFDHLVQFLVLVSEFEQVS